MKKALKITLGALAVILLVVFSITFLRRALIYNFAGIDDYQIFANRPVKTGTHQPWKIASPYNTQEPSERYQNYLKEMNSVAFLVAQGDSLVHEQYWDGHDSLSYSNSFSMAKSIVALLVTCAIEDGQVQGLDQKVGDFLPHYKEGRNKELTLRHLLTMSSGLNWDESYINPFSMTTRAYYGTNLDGLVNKLQVIDTPGQAFKYLSGNTQVLAEVLQKATGKNLSDYAAEKIWKPVGARQAALWSLDKEGGQEKAYCCFNSNARDYARLGRLMLNDGKWEGKQVLGKGWVDTLTSPANQLRHFQDGEIVDYYGKHFWLVRYNNIKVFYFRGILGQYIFVVPEENAVIVRLGHKRAEAKLNHHPEDVFYYLDAGLDLLPETQPN